MKNTFLCLLLVGAAVPARALTVNYTGIGLDIPDADPVGISDTRTVGSGVGLVTDVNVFMDISGDYNGDLYAVLVHDGGSYAVLLNRIGRSAGFPNGYTSQGLKVKLDDQSARDIHEAGASPGELTGVFQADARETDPSSTLDTDSRTAGLSSFSGIDPAGDWTLFVADVSPSGTSRLQSWALEFTTAAVPEAGNALAMAGSGVGCLVLLSRRSASKPRKQTSNSSKQR